MPSPKDETNVLTLLALSAGGLAVWAMANKESGKIIVPKTGTTTPKIGNPVTTPIIPTTTNNTRTGIVLPLTAAQRRARMMYLAGGAPLSSLDEYVYKPPIDVIRKISGYANAKEPVFICDIRYSLVKPGGRNPTTIDFGARTVNDGITFISADCMAGMAWCGGFDRFQPKQFAHIYGGWINTDSMLQDAMGKAKCFDLKDRPEVGCFVVYKTKDGKMGHIGGVVETPLEWDATKPEYWSMLKTVDMAARSGRGNRMGDPLVWYRNGAKFAVPKLTADLPGPARVA